MDSQTNRRTIAVYGVSAAVVGGLAIADGQHPAVALVFGAIAVATGIVLDAMPDEPIETRTATICGALFLLLCVGALWLRL